LESALDAYKYGGVTAWAAPLASLLAGFVAAGRLADGFDLIVASPTFVGVGGRHFDHTRALLQAMAPRLGPEHAARCDLGDDPAIVKTGPTAPLAGRPHRDRRRIAEEQIRHVLRVPDPTRTSRRRILVVDDVFTDGRTLDEVARALRLQGGARVVCGVSLCRQPWRGEVAELR
jgi:predicted amidophosphoribosyltransferase